MEENDITRIENDSHQINKNQISVVEPLTPSLCTEKKGLISLHARLKY